MSTFVLKHFPGMRAEEDYSYVSMAQQERYLLHLERARTERIRNDISKLMHNQDPVGKLQEHDPLSMSKLQDPNPIEQRLLDPARDSPAQPEFKFADDEIPVSTFTDDSNSNVGLEGRSSTVVVAAPPLRVALALDMVPIPTSRDSVGSLVSAMLQRTVQAWTWFHDLLFPRIYFRGRDLRCKPGSE